MFNRITYEQAVEFRDHVAARESYRLRDLAVRMEATGGPLDQMDATLESLVPLWEWFVGFVLADCPGVPEDAVPSLWPIRPQDGVDRASLFRRGVAVEGLEHYLRLVLARIDPPSQWGIYLTPKRARVLDYIHHRTGITRSDGAVLIVADLIGGANAIVDNKPGVRDSGLLRTWGVSMLLSPKSVPDQQRGPSVLVPYLTADLGEMPPIAAVSPIVRWEAEAAANPPAPTVPVVPRGGQDMTLYKGPGRGLEEPRLLKDLPHDQVARALAEAGFLGDDGAPVGGSELLVDMTMFGHRHEVAQVTVLTHRGTLRAVHFEPAAGTQAEWDEMIAPVRVLAAELGARLEADADAD